MLPDVISIRIDSRMLKMLKGRAKLETRTLTNMILSIIATNGCTGCPMFSKENGIRKCGNTEITGFVAKQDQNPIPNWCPLGSENNEP